MHWLSLLKKINNLGIEVYITGVGLVSALGMNEDENLQSLKNNAHGISTLEILDYSIHSGKILVGEVKKTNADLKKIAQLKNINSNSRGALFAIIAAKEALAKASLNKNEIQNCALISGTSVGGMDLFEQGYAGVINQKIENPKYYFQEHDCGNINYKIANEIGFKSYLSTISTACSSSANAIILGARMIKAGLIERAVVGGSDALSKFTINGFNTLGILDTAHTKPFDEQRKGLNLGEGAAYIVLESSRVCQNKKIYGQVCGFGNANDSFHQTASSDQGIGSTIAMKQALDTANVIPSQIDYVNTHGTGTPNNDFSESNALIDIFGKNTMPAFNSLKPFTGHTLAACGSIEAIFSLFSLNENVLFKSLNFEEPIKETGLIPITSIKNNANLKYVLSNSFGFGGNCSSIIYKKAQ